MSDFNTILRAKYSNEAWIGLLLLGKMGGEPFNDEEKEYIINYLINTNDHVTIRVLELLGLVEVNGELDVTIDQLKKFRATIITEVSRFYDDMITDDNTLKHNLAPLNKEIRKYLKFWDEKELEYELFITETMEESLNKIERDAFTHAHTDKMLKEKQIKNMLLDCQGEHTCIKTVVDFRPNK